MPLNALLASWSASRHWRALRTERSNFGGPSAESAPHHDRNDRSGREWVVNLFRHAWPHERCDSAPLDHQIVRPTRDTPRSDGDVTTALGGNREAGEWVPGARKTAGGAESFTLPEGPKTRLRRRTGRADLLRNTFRAFPRVLGARNAPFRPNAPFSGVPESLGIYINCFQISFKA